MYVNTSAEVKAETDYCCTSSNAVKVVEHILREHGPDTEILFGPDMWLGSYVERGLASTVAVHVWPGECHVHAGIRPDDITAPRRHPGAEFLVHPECGCVDPDHGVRRRGRRRSGRRPHALHRAMLDYVGDHPEGSSSSPPRTGCSTRCSRRRREASLIEANRMAFCKYMKMITLPKLRDSLREMKFEVSVPAEIAERARLPIERMVAIG